MQLSCNDEYIELVRGAGLVWPGGWACVTTELMQANRDDPRKLSQ